MQLKTFSENNGYNKCVNMKPKFDGIFGDISTSNDYQSLHRVCSWYNANG